MGSLFSSNKPHKILLTGIDAAGKTTMLYRINAAEMKDLPVIGLRVETTRVKNLDIICWDAGGQVGWLQRLAPLKRRYLTDVAAVIYMVDANDIERIEESVQELERELTNIDRDNLPVLILANKMDLPNAVDKTYIRSKFDLPFMQSRAWYVQSSCAMSGDGLYEGLDWLTKEIEQKAVKKADVRSACKFKIAHKRLTTLLYVKFDVNTMGNLINSTPTPEYKILLSGLDAAGKTTMLYKIRASDMTAPSMSLWTVDTAHYKNFQIISWDSGGQLKLWPIKRQYLTNIAGVIYFIDANDRERLAESIEELEREIVNVEHDRVTAEKVPVLIFANKMDLPNAMNKDEIRAAFDLSMMKRRAWYIQPSCATSGDGLFEGLDWFTKEIERGSHRVTAACDVHGGEA